MDPFIAATGTAVPPYAFRQSQLKKAAERHFQGSLAETRRLLSVYDSVQVRRRHLCVGVEWLSTPHTFQERNALYQEWAEKLAAQAAQQCLKRARVSAGEVGHLIFVSSTGVATPSLDARLIAGLGLGRTTRRTPIFGLGCAGGAAGLSLGFRLAREDPSQSVLLVAVEINSLTFQPRDMTKTNFVASALFADGAAAALIRNRKERGSRSRLHFLGHRSSLWPDTAEAMGWQFTDSGLKVILDKSIPLLLRRHLGQDLEELLREHQLQLPQIRHFLIHPGGARILETFQNEFDLPPFALQGSREILDHYGNMSSPTLLFILDRHLRREGRRPGDHVLAAAFGPGFSSELLLLRWNGPGGD